MTSRYMHGAESITPHLFFPLPNPFDRGIFLIVPIVVAGRGLKVATTFIGLRQLLFPPSRASFLLYFVDVGIDFLSDVRSRDLSSSLGFSMSFGIPRIFSPLHALPFPLENPDTNSEKKAPHTSPLTLLFSRFQSQSGPQFEW